MTPYRHKPPFDLRSASYNDNKGFGVEITAHWFNHSHGDTPALIIRIPFTHEEMQEYSEEGEHFNWMLHHSFIIDTLLDNPGQFYVEVYRAIRELFAVEYPGKYKELSDSAPF